MNETTVREWAAVAVAFGLVRDGASLPPPATSIYAWTPGDGGSTTIYRLGDLPVTDVPLVSPAQITAFGPAALDASAAHLAALTLEQVAALDAPDSRYWVGCLSREQQLALTPVEGGDSKSPPSSSGASLPPCRRSRYGSSRRPS